MDTTTCAATESLIPATVLLIDSDPERSAAAARLLEESGYSVVAGASAAQAISLACLYRPDLMLLDVGSEDDAAEEIARQIKLEPQLAGVFVVLVTGERRRSRGEAAGSQGAPADGYLTRHCGGIEFLDRIESFLRIRSAQEQLRESEQRYRMLFSATQNGFALHAVVCDSRGVPCDCRFLEVNHAFEELTGLAAADIIGRSVREVIPDTWTDWTEAYRKVALSGQPVRLEGFFGPRRHYYQVEVYAPQPGQLASIFTDVTDRKRTEEALLEAHKLSGDVQEVSKLGGWKYELATGRLTWTDEVRRIYGVDQDFDCNDVQRALSFYAPEDRPVITRAFERAVQQGEPYDLEVRLVPQIGEQIWVRTVGSPVTEHGEVVSVVGNIVDITGRKQAEQALRASEERYLAIINAFDGVIYICSPDYRITFMNDELIRRRGRAIGEHCYRALHDLEDICPWCVNERVFAGEVVKWEVRSPKDGCWYYCINSPVRNPDGTVSKQAMIHDITHLKMAQEELMFKSFTLDNLAEEIYWLSADGKIMDVNQAACAKLGYTREEFLSLGAADIEPPSPEEGARLDWGSLKRSGSLSYESWHRTKEGLLYPVEVVANYLNLDGREYNCSIVRDITELRQARQEILKAQKLESIGVLVGGIAHDFNNILTAVLGNISLARFQIQDPEKVAKRLEDAENAAARAKDLTQQLLTFARGGAPVKKVIQLAGLVREAAAFALHGSSVGCAFSLPGDLWALEADEGQLVQVVHNLVLNAVQAMPTGGTVAISARNAPTRLQGGDAVELSVCDTGTGISEQHLDRIFDPYFTTKQQGSGLGLSSSYSIVKKHGGTITAESTLGQGSCFNVVLPAFKLRQSPPDCPGPEISGGSSRVLVMDDEEIVRVLAKAVLEQLGYQAVCVADGA
jgi:PAS domain S-box-containing protein